jgi:hypothetical protein
LVVIFENQLCTRNVKDSRVKFVEKWLFGSVLRVETLGSDYDFICTFLEKKK